MNTLTHVGRLLNKTIHGLFILALFPLTIYAQEEQSSAAEMAAKLANPSVALGQMSSNFDFTFYRGSLDNANNQFAFVYSFQPTIPFTLKNGKNLFFRPAIPILFKQPVYTGSGWENKFALGEISFDFAYGGTNSSGFMLVYGVVGTLPTATDDNIGAGHWAFGPEILIGLAKNWGVFGLLTTQRWSVGETGDTNTNLMGGQYFYAFPFGDGTTQIAAGPSWSLDFSSDNNQLTLPLGIGLAKTTILGQRTWKFAIEYWYYAASSDIFGPGNQIRLVVTPVVNLPWQ